MVINRKVLPWLIAGVALGAILLIVLVMVTQAAPNSAPHRQGASISPGVVSYQGQVNIGGVPFSGTGYFRFAIVDSGGTFYWSNDSSIMTPTEAVTLTVVNGLFNVLLGETNPITYGMFSNSDRWLRVWFDDSIHGVQLLEPDTRITTALFALRADESMTAITSTWSTTATVAITATNATTATFATTALWATQCLSATQWAWYSAFSGNAGTCGTALYALQMTQNSAYFLPVNFARVGGNSWWGPSPVTESVAPGQVSYWTTDYPFTQTNVLTGSSALTFNGSTLSTTNLNVSGSFSATVLTATNATTATYATTALTATNATTATYATTALTATNATTATYASTVPGYIIVQLAQPVIAINATFSTVAASTEITNTTLGIPASAKGILYDLSVVDSVAGQYFRFGPSATYYYQTTVTTQVTNQVSRDNGLCFTDSNGSIWYRSLASGSNTLTVYMRVWGYLK